MGKLIIGYMALGDRFHGFQGFPVAQTVKNPPAMQETWVQSLGWEDPLEKGKAAAAAKSFQSCPTPCDPIDGSPPGSSVHRIL